MNRIARALGIQFANQLKPLGLTPAQFAVLQDIDEHPGTAQHDISARTSMDMPTLTELLLRMEQRGYITRERDEQNRRRYVIHLCDQTDAMLADARDLASATNSYALAGLSAQELDTLFDLLARVERNLK
ncbi:Transcriptional regulator SlyA [Corynebacterium freiburgense]|nr:Transcriptional regulator SlyA [Corynebacterium freiburgense]